MPVPLTLQEENMLEVFLVQSMVGAITPNFRRITLLAEAPELVVEFVLEHENAEDREEIADIVAELDCLLGDFPRRDLTVRAETTVGAGPLAPLKAGVRFVYGRKEELGGPSVAPQP